MKKLYTLAALLMLSFSTISFKASAQADLALAHGVSDTIECGNLTPSYIFPFRFINFGPDALTQTDTLYLRTFYTGYYNTYYKLTLPPTGFPVGDTLYWADTTYFEHSFAPTSAVQWCDSLWARNNTNAIIVDPVIANNKACSPVQIINDPTNIKNTTPRPEGVKLNVYPNPATNSISFDYYTNSVLEPIVSVTDITGRRVIRKSLGKVNGANKASIDVADLSNGMYILELNFGYKKQVGKFYIQK